ncbi:MAG TPA: response regulator [Burkholderiales bacterium]|nr:response regulator [Burkholderiales bacterium]
MPQATELPQKRVLVVDDSKFVRATFAAVLKSVFPVREEVDGEAAWTAIQEDPTIILIFTDLDMPKLDGFGLVERIRASSDARIRSLPIVMISGNEQAGVKERARAAGVTDFISKSADPPELLARLDNVLQVVTAAQQADATHDRLTGALTEAYLRTESAKRYSYALRHDEELSLMAMRIDSVGDIVRTAGKDAAEQLVARIAKLLMGQVRTEDSVARTAAATFMVVAPGTAGAQMAVLAKRLQGQLAQARVSYGQHVLKIASSVGVSSRRVDPSNSIDELMSLALQRLDGGAPPAQPVPESLPPEIDQALHVLEHADLGRLVQVSPELIERLKRIAKKLH